MSVSQCQGVLMGSDLRTDSMLISGVWQNLGAITQWFGTTEGSQFSQMRCLGFALFCGSGVCWLFFKGRMWGGPPRG